MKILFKNTTKYTKENCKNFIKFHNNKYGTKELIGLFLGLILLLYMLIFNIVNKNWILFASIGIVILLIFLINSMKEKIIVKTIMIKKRKKEKEFNISKETIEQEKPTSVIKQENKKIQKSIIKSRKKNTAKTYVFYFYKNFIRIKCRKLFKIVLYLNIKKVYETDDYFFIYLGEKEPWMLRKDGFSIGTSEEFSKFIKKKCILRYKDEEKKGE